MVRMSYFVMGIALIATTGCLKVSTPNVDVEVGKLPHFGSGSSESSQPRTEYADTLEDVIKQQSKLLEEMNGGSWSDLYEEAAEWVQDIRTLSGHADASHDPKEFRQQCDRLMEASVEVRQAARARDAARAQKALDDCDPLLNKFCRTFPLTHSVAKPQRAPGATSESQSSPAQRTVVP